MPIVLKDGEQREGLRYKSIKELNRGAMANAHKAEIVSGVGAGRIVFLKQYKSPSCTVPWFELYVDYQKEMKQRIEANADLRDRCYEMIEFVINKGGKDRIGVFYQAFEFVERGIPLSDYIKQFREDAASVEWRFRVVFARIMMYAIELLHKGNIVHTDLKPDNLFMVPSEHGAGFRLKIIDLDFSIFSDKQAPWHGKNGYVGTPGYKSPEHLTGKVPTKASDIYTCGLILGELLGHGHPLRDEEDIEDATKNGRFKPVKIEQKINRIDDVSFMECVINSCFELDPSKRPTAQELYQALKGETFDWWAWTPASTQPPPASPPVPPTPPTSPPPSQPEKPAIGRVELYFNDEKVSGCGVDTVFGKRLLKSVHSDAQFLSPQQFRIYKDSASGKWTVSHCNEATNETLVNGEAISEPVFLNDGMRIAVGNSAKGIEKLPLTVFLTK